MRGVTAKTKLAGVLALVAILVVIGVLNLKDRLGAPPIPTDGVTWVDTDQVVKAKDVSSDSPLALVAVHKGDYLRGFFYQGKYELVAHAEDVSHYLDKIGVGGEATYVIEHTDPALQSILGPDDGFDVKFSPVPQSEQRELGFYLAAIGLVYLGIGLYVLF